MSMLPFDTHRFLEDSFLLFSVLDLDDGTKSIQCLMEGTEKEVKHVAETLPAVSYSGTRQVLGAKVQWVHRHVYVRKFFAFTKTVNIGGNPNG